MPDNGLGSTSCRAEGSISSAVAGAGLRRYASGMASKTTLNAKNLETLGAARLAGLLIEVSAGSAVAKRRLRLELAGAQSPQEAGREVAKRLTSIARARSRMNWKTRKALVRDLESQLQAIRTQIAPADPAEALALAWRFLQVATPLLTRCDDSGGTVIDLFHRACTALGDIALAAQPAPEALADAAVDALHDNVYGQYGGLISDLAPALGAAGLTCLRQRIEGVAASPVPVPQRADWKAVGYRSGGVVYAHQLEEQTRQALVRTALRDIADAQGDVDGFIAQHDPARRKLPDVCAEIATRLLAAGRAEEALVYLDAAAAGAARDGCRAWQDIRLDVLEALCRRQEAQAFRLACFTRDLSADLLRAYLKRLPDFEDIEAEERAMAHAASYPDVFAALVFFLGWPALDQAARLLQDRHGDLTGDLSDGLAPAAELLSVRYPLAAMLALRAMIDATLTAARSARYSLAAGYLATCAELDTRIDDLGRFEAHAVYVARLKSMHGKKSGFWSRVDG